DRGSPPARVSPTWGDRMSDRKSDRMSDPVPPGAVISIGNFDGVHVGHRALLSRMRELADTAGAPAAVITFFPPAKVFFTGADYLSTAEEKLLLLEEFRPDKVVMVP